MRSSTILSGLFAIGTFALPNKRALIYETDIVDVTVTVYVTEDGAPPATSVKAEAYTPAVKQHHYSHPVYTKSSATYVVPATSAAPIPSAPAYTPPVVSSAPVYTPPASSSTPKASSAAPVSSAASSSTGGVGPAHVTGDAQCELTEGEDYKNMILFHHNINRAIHGVGELTWDDKLASDALACASKCAQPFQHCNAGQNMAGSAPIANISAGITEGWVNGEVGKYPGYGVNPDMANFEEWGHFSQVVWKETTKVGCGTSKCSNSGMWITICNYDPMGNSGDYAGNVLAPVSNEVAHWYD